MKAIHCDKCQHATVMVSAVDETRNRKVLVTS